ncbi:F-box protein SKIP19 [Trifolium pratense]|uniref:F-box protein SKIP19 n=1 Tax=Trifolium pratense TaxID=57577 RepID=A0A2K3LX88_TRIPR|nr:F-box protein SKIP19 [Trifolium pratense]
MRILNSWKVSDKGFIDVVRKLPQLEEVDISWSNIVYKDSLEALGRSCPLLKSLKFNRMWPTIPGSAADNDDDALIISETMPRLFRLEITGTKLTNIGLLAILDGCPLLEYLDIQACSNLSLSESLRKRCLEQIKEFRQPMLDFFDDRDYFEYCINYCR